MANSNSGLGVKVVASLARTESKQAINSDLKIIKADFEKNPIKLAFGVNKNKTLHNIKVEVNDLLKHLTAPTLELKIKINQQQVSAQLQNALNLAQNGGSNSSNSAGSLSSSEYKEFISLANKISGLKNKLSEMSALNPDSINQIRELTREITAFEAVYNGLVNNGAITNMSADQFKGWTKTLDEITNKANLVQAKIADAQNKAAKSTAEANIAAQNSINTIQVRAEANVKKLQATYKNMGLDMTQVQAAQQALNAAINDTAPASEKVKKVERAYRELNAAIASVNTNAQIINKNLADRKGFDNLSAQLDRWVRANDRLKNNADLWADIQKLQGSVRSYSGTLEENQAAMAKVQARAEELGLTSETLGQKFNKLWTTHWQTAAIMAGIHLMQNGMKQVYQSVVEVDTAMTQLQIVTRANSTAMKQYGEQAAQAAKEASAGVVDIIDSMTTYARLGLNNVGDLAKYTAMYANVSGSSVGDATTAVTSIIKGFKADEDDIERILSELVVVGNKYAISSEEIGIGLANAGSALSATGNTLEEAIGELTAANASVNNFAA